MSFLKNNTSLRETVKQIPICLWVILFHFVLSTKIRMNGLVLFTPCEEELCTLWRNNSTSPLALLKQYLVFKRLMVNRNTCAKTFYYYTDLILSQFSQRQEKLVCCFQKLNHSKTINFKNITGRKDQQGHVARRGPLSLPSLYSPCA